MGFLAWFGNCLFAATGGGFFDGIVDFAGVLLKLPQQFFGLAGDVLHAVVRKLAALLFRLALDDVELALDFKCCHKIS